MTKFQLFSVSFILITICLIIGGYWLKCRLPFQVSENISLSQYFPFKYLKRDKTIENPKTGLVMYEDFESFNFFSPWYHLWMHDGGLVDKKFVDNGYNSEKCLRIRSQSPNAWSLSPDISIQVDQGQVYQFKATVKSNFPRQETSLKIVAYNEIKQVISHSFFRQVFTDTNERWQMTRLDFSIPAGIHYIKPRIRGEGIGTFEIDDIQLRLSSS